MEEIISVMYYSTLISLFSIFCIFKSSILDDNKPNWLIVFATFWKLSFLATKSVSELTSTITLKESDEGHISNAILIDVKGDYFLSKSEEKLIKGKPIYIYCKSGARSKKATRILQANGFTKIYNLEGGILNWQAKKYKINK